MKYDLCANHYGKQKLKSTKVVVNVCLQKLVFGLSIFIQKA